MTTEKQLEHMQEAQELYNYITGKCNEQTTKIYNENYKRATTKYKKGFGKTAQHAFSPCIFVGAEAYNKEHGTPGEDAYTIFSTACRVLVAQMLYSDVVNNTEF